MINLGDFNTEFHKYVVEYPYVSNQPFEEPDGNPVLYLGFILAMKKRYFPLDQFDTKWVQDTYKDILVSRGLMSTSRFKKDNAESHDDRMGMAYASYFTDGSIAGDICWYGANHHWSFNNTGATGTQSWRFSDLFKPGVVQHYKVSAGLKLSLLDKLSWALNVGFPSSSESGLQLQWLMVDLYESQTLERSTIMEWAVSRWQDKMLHNSKYPHLMGSVFEIYFGAQHILAKLMQDII